MLQSMGLQRAGHDLATEQQQQCIRHVINSDFIINNRIFLKITMRSYFFD